MPLTHLAWILILTSHRIHGLENGQARTPPMGWMSWERFHCMTDCKRYPSDCISESLFQRTADLLVSEGYADVGYKYLIIDDCWMEAERDLITGRVLANVERFPRGLNWLSDYIHNKGLKFGLYHDIGARTCTNSGPGIDGFYTLDAQSFADWNVDYVKVDGCYTRYVNLDKAYPAFGQALNATGRPMIYSCSWPFYQKKPNYTLVKTYCNLWRFSDDIRSQYGSLRHIMKRYEKSPELQRLAGPGHWNDPDMLLLGNFFLSYEACQLQLAIWAIMAAPLIMSNDLATVRPEIKALLQNRDIIEVNQDSLGIAGEVIYTMQGLEIWARPINPTNNMGVYSQAVAFVLNEYIAECPLCPRTFTVSLKDLGLLNKMGYAVYDLFNQSHNLGLFKESDIFSTRINPQGVTFYKFRAADIY